MRDGAAQVLASVRTGGRPTQVTSATTTTRKHRLLVVDDDAALLRLVRTMLQRDGFEVATAADGAQALAALRCAPDLVILDVMLPDLDGFSLLTRILELSGSPVIILSACNAVHDRIRGLTLGADDYIGKPFDPAELSARVSAVLCRQLRTESVVDRILRYDRVTIDLTNLRITVAGQERMLSRTEWALLSLLAVQPGQVLTHGELLAGLWGAGHRASTSQIRTWVSRLRRTLHDPSPGRPLITTFPGVGYRLEAPASRCATSVAVV